MSDMIDRDAFIEEMEKHMYRIQGDDGLYPLTPHQQTMNTAFQIAIEVAEDMPAVESDHDNHGYWIPMTVSSGRDSWKCSICGRRARGKTENLPFCHCGAKMDGKEQEDETRENME